MTINVSSETLISFASLAASLPSRRRNRPVHPSTVHRWCRLGIKGIRLEAVRVGGAWHTTREAFARFCERLTAAESEDGRAAVTTTARRQTHQRDDRELDAAGW